MIQRPAGMGALEFVVLAKLRAAQLMRGCVPRVQGDHKATVIAQLEVALGKVSPSSEGSADALSSADADETSAEPELVVMP